MNELIVLFTILSLGHIASYIKIRSIGLGIASVLLIGIGAGAMKFQLPIIYRDLGLVIFMFSVGIQAGPGFLAAFNRNGLLFNGLALAQITLAFLVILLLKYTTSINPAFLAGLFAGSFTNTSGLATIMDLAKNGSGIRSGHSLSSIGFGLAYPFGVIMVIFFLYLVRRVARINMENEKTIHREGQKKIYPDIFDQVYVVINPSLEGKTIAESNIIEMLDGAVISRIMHHNHVYSPKANSVLYVGDKIVIVGPKECHKKAEILIGSCIQYEMEWPGNMHIQTMLVTNRRIVNKTIRQINISGRFGANITRVRRGNIDLSPDPELRIQYGDRLIIVSYDEQMPELTSLIGNSQKTFGLMDFVPFSLGILFGLFIAMIPLPIPNVPNFRIGPSVGVLLSGIILSQIGKTWRIIWRIPETANRLLKELGLSLFLATVGTNTGMSISLDSIRENLSYVVISPLIIVLPMVIIYIIGRYLFKINFLDLAGILCGGTSSTPGLATANEISDSDVPSVAYALVYPVCLTATILYTSFIFI
ncbi:MAG: hypothetical protein HQK54_02940 [Oligoflexales bacterium]|nr:hypothetical protein [Oligoflexales bacterium]